VDRTLLLAAEARPVRKPVGERDASLDAVEEEADRLVMVRGERHPPTAEVMVLPLAAPTRPLVQLRTD
jgi:hypothetical protein